MTGNDRRSMRFPRPRGVSQIDPKTAQGTARYAGDTRPDLPAQLPDSDILEFGCFGILVPAGLSTPNAGWYGLASYSVGSRGDSAEEAIWTSWMLDTCGADAAALGLAELSTAFGGVAAIAWGSSAGMFAYVVMGVNLPCVYGQWTDGPTLPTLGTTGEGLQTLERSARKRVAVPLQHGSFSSGANVMNRSENRAPLALRIAKNDRIDVALVVRSTVTNGRGTAGYIRAQMFGHLVVSKLTSPVELGS